MNDYIHICVHCGKSFDIKAGEGWGRSYLKERAMLPSTIYECSDCMERIND